MIVILQRQRQFFWRWSVWRADVMAGWPGEFDVVLGEDAVVKDGDVRGASDFAIGIETRAVPDDVVGLPLAWSARGVDQRRILAVDRGGLAIGVSLTVVGIEHLNLVCPLLLEKKNAAVLIFTFRRIGLGEFHMQLAVAERVLGADVASLGHDFEVSVFHFPFGGAAVFFHHPLRQVFSIKENCSVGRRLA